MSAPAPETPIASPTLLVVEHEADAPPGNLARRAATAGLVLDVTRPYAGEALPVDLGGHGGIVVLGGEMGAHDDDRHPWLTETKGLVRAAADRGVPLLGICLGHQLAAVALGGDVAPSPAGTRRGVVPVRRTDAGRADPLLRHLGEGAATVHWNGDVVTALPAGAVLLATDPDGAPQAIRFGPRAWGVQCHPEVTADVVDGWAAGATPADAEAAGRAARDVRPRLPGIDAAWEPVLAAFLQTCRARVASRA